jgi:hypothetical protein
MLPAEQAEYPDSRIGRSLRISYCRTRHELDDRSVTDIDNLGLQSGVIESPHLSFG